jgi:hypothetical protein
MRGWSFFEHEAEGAFVGKGRFPIRAYSEYMPPPYVGIKPYAPRRGQDACTARAVDDGALDITEYEQAEELGPGLARIASLLVTQMAKLARGTTHLLSHTLLDDNPAWPRALREAAERDAFRSDTSAIALSLALSRTQDDKGNVRWTLFGCSHEGSHRPFWASFGDDEADRFLRVVGFMAGKEIDPASLRVVAAPDEAPPAFARRMALGAGEALDAVRAIFTFQPFAHLPPVVQRAYLDRSILLLPSPGSLAFFQHKGYAALGRALPLATQIPLLHLFPRVEGGYAIRIPQSGWLDEHDAGHDGFSRGHRVVSSIVRSHRWQRVERDQPPTTDCAFADKVSVALFSTAPDDLGLYDKPMARNAHVWTEGYGLLLDGPRADRAAIEAAARSLHTEGRFGYRFFYPPMRAGARDLFWHLPLVARLLPGEHQPERYEADPPRGYVTAEAETQEPVVLSARLLDRPLYKGAATLFPKDPGHARNTQSHNARKLLDFAEMLGSLPATFARALVQAPKHATLDDVLSRLVEIGQSPEETRALVAALRAVVIPGAPPGDSVTFGRTATRDYEERLWRTIADLSEGDHSCKENADPIPGNEGKTGGAAARQAGLEPSERSDLARHGDRLRAMHEDAIRRHGMVGKADVLDHAFRWETDFEFDWSLGWKRSQEAHVGHAGKERNIVVRIPGKRRDEAVIMADHYDTAYMEDVYDKDRGGDGLRAAAQGADDDASGTAALLLAAEVLLPLAREGKLERDVWLVHLTGEEFPSDCMGARALASALVEESLVLTGPGGDVDASKVRVAGAVILDMVAHNNLRDKDTFLVCPGEGAASARIALAAHAANVRWNHEITHANLREGRDGNGRATRMEDGRVTPPLFEHLAVYGKVAAEWEPRSVLYNTDGQIFSDVGIPVVLFMENYDINRTGYHDTHDTMKNIDLDYASALTAIAIETVTSLAMGKDPPDPRSPRAAH